jgi:flagellar basal-body rod modification protein FlgD
VRLGEDTIKGSVQLGAASSATSLVLTGIDGQQHRISLPTHGAGSLPFTIDPAALGLAPGNYSISAEASDGTKPAVEITARLDSVRMSAGGGILLQVAGLGDVDPSSITGFNGKAKVLASLEH